MATHREGGRIVVVSRVCFPYQVCRLAFDAVRNELIDRLYAYAVDTLHVRLLNDLDPHDTQ